MDRPLTQEVDNSLKCSALTALHTPKLVHLYTK